MGKLMISISGKTEERLRKEIGELYHGRVGGLSIFFEILIREYFERKAKASLGARSASKTKAVSKQ